MQTTISLVACVAGKLDRAAPAAQLYQSDWFSKASAYAAKRGRWFVLSARYGLVAADQVIEPYEVTLNTMTKAERVAWAARVADQVRELGLAADTCVVLAGKHYRENLLGFLNTQFPNIEFPLIGLGIGNQKQKLMQLIKE